MAAQAQAQAKQVQKSEVSRSEAAQRKQAKRKLNRKETDAAPAYLQAKLNVSAPEDPHEKEADQVADNVMRMPVQRSSDNQSENADRKINRASLKPGITPVTRAIARVVSRDSLKPGEQEIHRASLKPGEDAIQRMSDDDSPDSGSVAEAETAAPESSKVENRINAKRGQGERLPDAVLADMESRFGRDFSAVRIHTDKDSSEMSRDIEAKAFTVGNDIFFGSGRFDANSDDGRRLLAHELTHVAQQQQATDQKEDETEQVSRSETKAQRWSLTSWLKGKAWKILKKVAPKAFYNFVRTVSRKGIVGYLEEIITKTVSSIFNGLKRGKDVLSNFFTSFVKMAKTAKEIVIALAAGDCKPLFAAVKRLKKTIGEAAGDAWEAIKKFFKPIGEFFTNLWNNYGKDVFAWLKEAANDIWVKIKNLGKKIWEWTKPVRDYGKRAWNWLKGVLKLNSSSSSSSGGGGGNSEGGVMGWIKDKAQFAWEKVKKVMNPVIKPAKKIFEKVKKILPLKAIMNLRETVQGWLKKSEAMGQAMGDDGAGVADKQISLRETILPAVIKTVKSVRDSISAAGVWLGDKISGLASIFTGFIAGLRENSILKHIARLLSWVETAITSLSNWAKVTVKGLFDSLGNGLVKMAKFIEPVLDALKGVADTILNLMVKLPKFILGRIWKAIPKCIRDPLKDFIINQILGRIPFFKQLLAVKDAWKKIKQTGLLILQQVFKDGNLFGALWTLFKAILRIFNLPPKLITNIIVKASQALGAIIAAPIDFLINILRAMKLGFTNFFGNILTHLLKGAMDWLFGAVKDSGLTPPTDFSLKSIFTFVMDVLGLTIELVWKKLAEKIGQDKVDKLKGMIEYASGALEWIKLVINSGPGALWEKLKEKLSELWNMVLDGVIGWINEKIIAWATRWLLSLLDVTGIMPVINAVIAIYKAIESFMQYLKAMLEIVNTVLNGVADLAAGAIESAAKFLENALVAAIPIVIGFLANQAGLGNIAEKIQEILAKIRCKVEEAVGWLVGKVVDAVKAFVDKIKSGMQAIKEWWKKKKPFKTKSGQSHTLYTSGSKNSLKFMVASKPKDYAAFLAGIVIADSDPEKTKKQTAKSKATTTFNELVTLSKALTKSNADQGKQDTQSADFDKKLALLAEYTAVLMEGQGSDPVSSPPVYGGLTAAGYGTSMFVPRLTANGPKGSRPTVPHGAHYSKLNQRKTPSGKGSFYIMGHLLNENLHGPGNTWKNLTPLTRWANNNDVDSHLKGVEAPIKTEVCDNKRIIEYKVQAVYGRSLRTDLIAELDKGSDPHKDVKKQVIKEEALVPSELKTEASIVGYTRTEDKNKKPKKLLNVSESVNNSRHIDKYPVDKYVVDGQAVVEKDLIKLAVNDERKRSGRSEAVKAFSSNVIAGIGVGRANLILGVPAPQEFESWNSMKKRIREYAKDSVYKGDEAKAASEATGIYNALVNNDKVTLNGKTEWK